MGNCHSEQIENPIQIRNIDIQQAQLGGQSVPNTPIQAPKGIPPYRNEKEQISPPTQKSIFLQEKQKDQIPPQLPKATFPQKQEKVQVPTQNPKVLISQESHKVQPSLLIPKYVPELIISKQAQDRAQILLGKFSICSYISELLDGAKQNGLDGVAYTQNQAMDLAKALLQGVVQLEMKQSKEQRQAVQKIFDHNNIELIKNQKLYYNGMLEKLKKKDQQVGQNIKSRVYHKIANLKKENEIKKQWKNKFQINCLQSNQYKLLSQRELDNVVKYEVISDHVLQMGDKIGFKFESIKRQSNTILEVLSKVMVKHNEQINKLQYELKPSEVMTVASISRYACEYYDNGVFLLLNYFFQSCKRLQNSGKSSQEIEKMLNDAIENISKKYPPGQGLSKENQSLIKNLKQLQIQKQDKFSHQPITMSPTNKQAQVQQIIMNYAKTAYQCKDLFELLVKSTCIQKAVLFKIGLKLYPKNPNKKAMTRIKEKMFFAKDQKGQKQMKGTIKQILAKQENNYTKIIDELLEKSTTVSFKISDMVRGKCVFLQVIDIIDTVKSIKDFVSKDSRFTIQEIESRFTNPTPISDVTLKIVINNMIVAELQLTIQTNAAAYNFAHKIYQLQRTKVFSKLKITHNYFQESNDDFSQLANKALKLLDSKSVISKDIVSTVNKYFKLDSVKNKTFGQILPMILQQKKAQLPSFAVVIDPLLQDYMLGIYGMVTGVWYKQLGKIIDNVLKNQDLSSELKSVLISCFLDKFSLPKESEFMQQLGFTQQQLKSKIFMDEFIKEYFSIENIFKYATQNQRVFHRVQQLKQIKFQKNYASSPIELKESRFVVNFVLEQHCLQNISQMRQMFDFYFLIRDDQYDQVYPQFSYYYNWINTQLNSNKNLDEEGLLSGQIAIIKTSQLLQKGDIQKASRILEQAKKAFQKKQKQEKVIYCDVLLTECAIRGSTQTLVKSIEKHNAEVIKKAVTLGLELKGALYADALWRISEHFWKLIQNPEERKTLLLSFTKMALKEMSRSKGTHFIKALMSKWSQFKDNGLEQCQILQNDKIGYAKIDKLDPNNCFYLTLAKWTNLKRLNLSLNNIGDEGCMHLSKGKWDNIIHLDLWDSQIGSQGCKYLSNAKWGNLIQLDLNNNKIGNEGCKHLSTAKWDNLEKLNLMKNSISFEGCKHLSSAKWDHLAQLNLENNDIRAAGCKYLSAAKWENLSQLNLSCNQIDAEGCSYLTCSKWDNLNNLNLGKNHFGAKGCMHLSSAKWDKLSQLNLYENNIGLEGCKHLISAKWDNLTQLNLGVNGIDAETCKILISAKWNLARLNLVNNSVGDQGCKVLISAKWDLSQLDLGFNGISAEGCKLLLSSKWDNLTQLSLGSNKFDKKQLEQLKALLTKKFRKLPSYWSEIW